MTWLCSVCGEGFADYVNDCPSCRVRAQSWYQAALRAYIARGTGKRSGATADAVLMERFPGYNELRADTIGYHAALSMIVADGEGAILKYQASVRRRDCVCEGCGTKFKPKTARRDKAQFCSMVCYNDWRRQGCDPKPCAGCGKVMTLKPNENPYTFKRRKSCCFECSVDARRKKK